MRTKSGFTLIELMVAMIVGLTAVTTMYSLGSAMSKQFYQEQRIAVSQGTARVAIMELRRDISRAALFGSPNAELESRCETLPARLPELGGGTLPMGAFQYYFDEDLAAIDPDSNNIGVGADRLRILSSLYLTDQLLVGSVSPDGLLITLQTGNQAYRRTFAWGQAASAGVAGNTPDYLDGTLDWDAAWGGEAASWNGISQKGARAFQTGSVLHIETPEGRHFFRTVFGKSDNTQNEVRLTLDPGPALPVNTACLPGAGEGASVAPLQWVEYAVIDPFAAVEGDTDFMDLDGVFDTTLPGAHPVHDVAAIATDDLLDSPNAVLVRRFLDPADGKVLPRTTQVLAEFVSNFEVRFVIDQKAQRTAAAVLSPPTARAAATEAAVNTAPHMVRSVLIDLGIRSPLEDEAIPYAANADRTRFEVNDEQRGSARVRHIQIEIPVMTNARKNLFGP